MHDQASELRELIRKGTGTARATPSPCPKLLVASGGRRGVGTTTIAFHLAAALARLRHATVLVDADPAGGDAAREVLQPGPAGLKILPAAGALGESSGGAAGRLIGQLGGLGAAADFAVVDAGNHVSPLVQRLWGAADLVLIVTSPAPASMMAAYASIKLLASRQASVANPPVAHPAAALHTLVNKAPRRSVAREVHARMAQACFRFLGIEVGSVGFVADDPRLASIGRAPVVIRASGGAFARGIRRLAKTVVRRTRRTTVTR